MENESSLKKQSSGFVYLLLFLFSVLFVILKFNTLSLPYFWDEAWVYAPALKEMSKHPGLLPSSLSDDLSRGHPLLFHFIGAIWIKIFGKSEPALHAFAFTISFSLLFSLFYIGKKLVNEFFGLVLFAALIAQDMFLGQSALVLPEVFLALGSLWVFYFFAKKKWIAYAIAGSLTVLIKEQGILLIGVLWFWSLTEQGVYYGFKQLFKKEFVKKQLLMALPLCILFAFLLIQKIQRGYFFFPTHIDMIKLDWNNTVFHLRLSFELLLGHPGGRFFFAILTIVIFLFAGKRIYLWKRLFIVLLLYITFKIGIGDWGFVALPVSIVFMSFFFVFFMYQVHLKNKAAEQDPRGPIPVFVLIFIGFSSINFFCNRYLLCLFPLVLFYFFYEIFLNLKNEKTFAGLISVLAIAFCAYGSATKTTIAEDGPYYPNAIYVQQDLIKFCEDRKLGAEKIIVPYVMLSNITNPENGFRKTDELYTNISNRFDSTSLPRYVLFTEFEVSQDIEACLNTHKYNSIAVFRHGNTRGEVLEKTW